jgi:hypothetical protein
MDLFIPKEDAMILFFALDCCVMIGKKTRRQADHQGVEREVRCNGSV